MMALSELLQEKGAEFAEHFKPHFLQREKTVFRFLFNDSQPFHLIVEGDEFSFLPGEPGEATVTLYVDNHQTCWDLMSGRADSMAAFMDGRYRADGNIVLSQLLLYLFRNDNPTIAYEVQD
ncbi:MAG: hypothetical protein HOC70_10510 [Gammaproteobacteria bacterium]|nr:hypothetical protein [Gammaproteobacteria bacterium]MBT4493666.1 hypothetical protein [Gammaproteobacteria bacterium]